MIDQEDPNLIALQEKLAAKESECRELQKQLHELRGQAQILQNKLAIAEMVYENLRPEVPQEGRGCPCGE
jgi:chromosome segregation ATPase